MFSAEFWTNLTITITGMAGVVFVLILFYKNLKTEVKRNAKIEKTATEAATQVAENKGRIDVIEVLLQERLEDKNIIIKLQAELVEVHKTSKKIKKVKP